MFEAVCPVHGRFLTSLGMNFGPGSQITMESSTTNCPHNGCNETARIVDGVYNIAEEARRVLTQPSVTREQLETFRATAKAVLAGSTTVDEAQAQLEDVSSAFATVLAFANKNDKALGILIGLIGLLIAYYAIYQAHADSGESHQDAVRQLVATQKQTRAFASAEQELRKSERLQRKIDAEYERLRAASQLPARQAKPRQQMTQTGRHQTQAPGGSPNRHERRAMASRARKRHPRS